jgi:hypothetical protein
MDTILYRAAKTPTAKAGACFTSDADDAAEYLDNPGYGGGTLYQVSIKVDAAEVLSLVDSTGRQHRDAWHVLAEALGIEGDDECTAAQVLRGRTDGRIEDAIDGAKVRRQLASAGYVWVVYEDTFPAACVTWVYLGTEPLALTEVDQ